MSVLRAYAAASGAERKAVSIAEVATVIGIHVGSVSNCNPFFYDLGLLGREGSLYRPVESVIEYANSYEWDEGIAAHKLASMFSDSWFAKILIPKLSFRALTKDEAVKYLADESKASPEYKDQLSLLLEYLAATGVIAIEGNSVSKGPNFRGAAREASGHPAPDASLNVTPPIPPRPVSEYHPFIEGLLKTLPKPETDWTLGARAKWLQAAANIFELIYTDDNGLDSKTLKVELLATNQTKSGGGQ